MLCLTSGAALCHCPDAVLQGIDRLHMPHMPITSAAAAATTTTPTTANDYYYYYCYYYYYYSCSGHDINPGDN